MKIGFVGQGFVGKHIADDFERRGYAVVRYALEPEYAMNKVHISQCDVVFIAVPTPTTPRGFDYSIVESALQNVGYGKIAVIKSTLLPGTTKTLQDLHKDKVILFSPEFLCESTATYDAAHPMFNIIGMAYDSAGHRKAAGVVARMLPQSDHNYIIRAHAAEFFKYVHNIHGFMRVVLSNVFFDLSQKVGIDWADIKLIMDNDPMMSPYYNSPVHKSGRGAGGNCFIKDFAAFKQFAKETFTNHEYESLLAAAERVNLDLLKSSGKDIHIIKSVYGE